MEIISKNVAALLRFIVSIQLTSIYLCRSYLEVGHIHFPQLLVLATHLDHEGKHCELLIMDYSISSGLITLKGFFQLRNCKEYQNVVIISFVHFEKINIFCFRGRS